MRAQGRNLRAGDLPGVAAGDGFVSLAPAAAPAGSGSTFATFDHDGRSMAAATVLCNRGGVPWPSSIQFYERMRKPFESGGVRWLGGVSLETLSHGDRDFVWSVRRNRGGTAVSVAWAANRDTDFGCCPTQDFSADLSPGATPKDRVRVEGLTAYDETAAADRLIRAARAGDAAGVRSLAGATDAATLLAIGRRLGRYSCHEHVDFDAGSWPADVVRRWGGLDAFTTRLTGRRACAVWVAGNPDVLVNLDHAGYRTWRVVDVQELGGD